MATSHYASDSEVLRDIIRKEQMRNAEIDIIRAELIKAEGRSFTTRSTEDIMSAVIARKKADEAVTSQLNIDQSS